MITNKRFAELNPDLHHQIEKIIDNEFGHIPIVKQTEWAKPDWTIIYFEGDEIASFYNIVERTILLNNKPIEVAGINNVITPPVFRGKGYSSKLLIETSDFIFQELKREIGLLLCADNLISFYKKLNWYKVDCPVYFNQNSGRKLWTANTMLLSKNKVLTTTEIDLNGLPW